MKITHRSDLTAMSCPTVKIAHEIVAGNDSGFVEINESDFDPKKHTRFVEKDEQKKAD